jgi:hypothetical protein
MQSRAPALVVLLTFAVGGVVAPVVHRAQHAAEAGAELAAHAAAGHHHHEVFGAHGVEWTPECDGPVVLHDLACVLCKGLSASDLPAGPAAWVPERPAGAPAADAAPAGAESAGATRVRGPPHRIV